MRLAKTSDMENKLYKRKLSMFNMLKKREMETLYKEPNTIFKNDQST